MNMKVAELKKTIGGYRTEQLRRLLVEMYKAMPKRVKEDHGIDDMICSPASKRTTEKVKWCRTSEPWRLKRNDS
jgi:hypothetical protein